jgi:hypothetical protein
MFLIVLTKSVTKTFFINNLIKKSFSQTFLIVLTKNVAKMFLLEDLIKKCFTTFF